MKKLIAVLVASAVLSGCAALPSDHKAGDKVVITDAGRAYNASEPSVRADRMCGNGKHAQLENEEMHMSYSVNTYKCVEAPVSELEQIEKEAGDSLKAEAEKTEKHWQTIPASTEGRKQFFLRESNHAFVVTCGWLGQIVFNTGKATSIDVAGETMIGRNVKYRNGEFSFNFNSGVYLLTFDVDKRDVTIYTGNDSYISCGEIYFGE